MSSSPPTLADQLLQLRAERARELQLEQAASERALQQKCMSIARHWGEVRSVIQQSITRCVHEGKVVQVDDSTLANACQLSRYDFFACKNTFQDELEKRESLVARLFNGDYYLYPKDGKKVKSTKEGSGSAV